MRDLRHESAAAWPDLAAYIAFIDLAGKAESSQYSYTRECALLLREFPQLAFADFTAVEINAALGLKPKRSRYITRSILNGWFQWGEDNDLIPRNPMRGGKVPKMRSPHRRPSNIFTDAEVAALEALPHPDGPLLSLMFGAGLRRADCRRCQVGHIDFDRLRVAITGKGEKDAIVPLRPETLRPLVDLITLDGLNREDFLWYTRPGGRTISRRAPISSSTFDRWWRGDPERGIVGVLERAGVRYLNPHQARHTYGHQLRERGYSLEERRLLMRHENIRTTDHYYGTLTIEDIAAKMAAEC